MVKSYSISPACLQGIINGLRLIDTRVQLLTKMEENKYQNTLDCLQSAFSLKIRLVLISASAFANYNIMLQQGIRTRPEKTYFFFSGRLTPSFKAARGSPLVCLGFSYSNFAKKNRRLLASKNKKNSVVSLFGYFNIISKGSFNSMFVCCCNLSTLPASSSFCYLRAEMAKRYVKKKYI